MSDCFNESIQVIALFKKFEQDLNELGVDYNVTLITNTNEHIPNSFHASNTPYTDHRMISVTTHPDNSVLFAECTHRTLDNVPVGEPYNPRLWIHQCSVHGFGNLKHNLQAEMLILGFDDLTNILKGK